MQSSHRRSLRPVLWPLLCLSLLAALSACVGSRRQPGGEVAMLPTPTLAPAFSDMGDVSVALPTRAVPTFVTATPPAQPAPAGAAAPVDTAAPAPPGPPSAVPPAGAEVTAAPEQPTAGAPAVQQGGAPPEPTAPSGVWAQPITATVQIGRTVSRTLELGFYPLPDLSTAYGAPLRRVPVLSGELDQNWTLENSWAVSYELQTPLYGRADHGVVAVRQDPGQYGTFFLSVRPGSQAVYERRRVAGIVFWISGGGRAVYDDDIAVTITGSNVVPFYRADDTSVTPVPGLDPEFPTFSETRLMFLNVDRVPPKSWIEVVLWLDEREYDPDYTYVTGIYFRTNSKMPLFFLDDISLLEIVE